MKNRKTYLYRYFSDSDILLYVGITRSISRRHAEHQRVSMWFKEHKKMTVEVFSSQEAAAAAEKHAITNEWPKYNINEGGMNKAGYAFDTVIVSVRLPHEEAILFDNAIKARSTNRTAVLRELIRSFTLEG